MKTKVRHLWVPFPIRSLYLRHHLFTVAICLTYLLSSSQTPSLAWVSTIQGMYQKTHGGIATDLKGNVYITGSFNDVTDFDPGPGTFTMTSGGSYQTDDIFI